MDKALIESFSVPLTDSLGVLLPVVAAAKLPRRAPAPVLVAGRGVSSSSVWRGPPGSGGGGLAVGAATELGVLAAAALLRKPHTQDRVKKDTCFLLKRFDCTKVHVYVFVKGFSLMAISAFFLDLLFLKEEE